jgi:tripartite-type tricarboxylate transporter receptor subunit TctC
MRQASGSASGYQRARPLRSSTSNREINAALADPKTKTRIAESGGDTLAGSPADFGKLIADETEKWSKVVRAANIKAE